MDPGRTDMYETFYGMMEPAFTLTPNPAFLYLNERSKEGLNQILYGIRRREGFALIGGDVGTGKTTLCWTLLERLDERNVRTALVQNSMLSATDILKSILRDFGVGPKATSPEEQVLHVFDTSWMAGMGKVELIERLSSFLIEMAHKGTFAVLIIDEAQNLSPETMEQLRLLSNIELAHEKLLQIIFVGQLELQQMLEQPALRQLNQRISVRFETRPLTRQETEEYVCHRLRVARAVPSLRFTRLAFRGVYKYSKGYPRLINMICDRALLCSFRDHSMIVTGKTIRRGFQSLHEPSRERRSMRIRKVLLVTGLLALALVILILVALKRMAPDKISASLPPPPPAAAPAVPESTGTKSTEIEAPAPVAAAPAETSRPEAAPPPPVSTAPAGQAEQGKYVVQVSSFREEREAEAASRELTASGFVSFVKFQKTGVDGGWFGVYVGPYDELAAARQTASTIESTRAVSPIVRRRAVE